jgi:hypothetical protein
MTTTIRMTEAVRNGAVKMLRLWGDCLKVSPVCRRPGAVSSPEPVPGEGVPLPGGCRAAAHGSSN